MRGIEMKRYESVRGKLSKLKKSELVRVAEYMLIFQAEGVAYLWDSVEEIALQSLDAIIKKVENEGGVE